MEALSAADLLDVWEQGASADVHERAMLLLAHARPEVQTGALGAVPLGRRDADLLRLRQATFGRRMAAVTSCPECGERLDLELDAAAIAVRPGDAAAPHVVVAGSELSIRPPTTDDLIAVRDEAVAAGSDRDLARRSLLTRLVDGDVLAPAAEIEAAIERAIAESDPALDVSVALACPACAAEWETTIDVPAYLWEEVVASARRLALEVAELAAAYGWREEDVLRLSAWRRRLYVGLAAE